MVPSPLKSWYAVNTEVLGWPGVRRKFALAGSMPSAIQATLTPAPVKPRDRAVLALGTVESVCVTGSASGSSWTPPLGRQAPGRVLMADDAAAGAEGAAGLWP